MKVKTRIAAVLVLAIAAVTLLVPAARAGPGTPGIDANDRAHFGKSLATTAMQDAHQRVGIVSQPRTLVAVDAHERLGARVSTPAPTRSSVDDAGFDWGAAAIGASSGLVFALLIGASLLTARRYRHRPLPR